MYHKPLFIGSHLLGERSFYSTYKRAVKSQWSPYSEQKENQEKQLQQMIKYAYRNVPFYHKLFNDLNLSPEDIKEIEDLEKLPILTKNTIMQNWEDFKPLGLNKMKYSFSSTAGSTGTPFQYRLLSYDRFLLAAMLYRGWGYGGYELGDKMVFLAGSSLDVGSKPFIVRRAHEITRNIRKLSSFDMGIEDMKEYTDVINSFNPKFLRGYPSAINFFVNYVKENDVEISAPDAVFSAAEKLLPDVRKNMGDFFGCDVYDVYGLNDGGVGAYECPEHNGLHIDTERSIMEIVDDNGSQMENGVGRILATSLYNYAMPFIRYETGDMGHIVEDVCSCGRGSRLLKEVMGRTVDVLLTPEGKYVHGYFLLYLFWDHGKGIKEYQVVQESVDKLCIKIVPDDDFDERQIDLIKNVIKRKSERWDVEFKFVDKIERSKSGKFKFIINETKNA